MSAGRAGDEIAAVDTNEQLRRDIGRAFFLEDEDVALIAAANAEIFKGSGGGPGFSAKDGQRQAAARDRSAAISGWSRRGPTSFRCYVGGWPRGCLISMHNKIANAK